MEFNEMTVEMLEERKSAIVAELDNPEADLDALENEARAIKEEIEKRKDAEQKKTEIREAVASGIGEVVQTFSQEEKVMPTIEEIRSSAEYAEAYKNYIIKGDDAECRALLTTNASGVVPVPVIVEETVKTAWEKNDFLSRVSKTAIRGNLKSFFELSADGAYEHAEGTTAPTEEALTLGVITMIPATVKKWITISDEAVAMGGEAFLRYIYDEITYQIMKKLVALCVADVTGASTSNGSTAIGVPKVNEDPSVTAIPKAAANLSEDAENLCVVMNRLTEVEFISAYAAGNFAVDPFAGLTKVYTSALPAFSTASANAVYAIVGDLSAIQVNYPEGEGVVIKYDDKSQAEKDIVKIVGRQYAAHAITKPGRLVNLTKEAAATT
ncbi:MAG: phage major capsid protein [Acutalibacteraceae bacterium]|nr:phage major capsid protein [Acutalibacteraceae bacterium]